MLPSPDSFTFVHNTGSATEETITLSLRGDGITARQLRYAFGRFMIACGYVPSTVDEVLNDWEDVE